MLGKIEGRRRRGQQRTTWLDGITNSMDMSLSQLQEMGKEREDLRAAVHGIAKSQTQLSGRTTEQQQVAVKKSLKAPKKVKSLMVVSSIPLLAI